MAKKISKIDKVIKKIQKSLKLTSYKISYFLKDDIDDSEYAEIICDLSKRKAVINLNTRKLNDDLEDTITHELLHLFFHKYLSVAENVFERQKKIKSLKKYREGEEKTIKILTSLLKRSIFPKKKKRG